MRQLVGARVEVGVAERAGLGDQRDRVGCASGLLLEQFGHAALVRVVDGGVVPAVHDQRGLGVGQHRQLGDGSGRVVGQRAQQRGQPRGHRRHGPGVEQVGVVLDQHVEPAVGLLGELDGDVEDGGHLGQRQPLGPRPGQRQRLVQAALQHHHRLHQRGAAGVTLLAQLVHQAFERNLLVRERTEHGLLHLPQEVHEGLLSVHCGAQDQGVDEAADEAFQLRPVAAGHGGAHGHVPLPGVPGEQHLAGGNQRHEQGCPVRRAELGQRPGERGGQGEPVVAAHGGAHGRPGAVGGQLQRREVGELLPPVVQVRGQPRVGEQVALPHRGVGVAQRQRGEPVHAARVVERAELLHQQPHGPAVHRDVVQAEQQHVLVGAESDHHEAHHRAVDQVERGADLVGEHPLQLGLGGLHHADRRFGGRVHHLGGRAVDEFDGGAQRLVPLHQSGARRPHRGQVEFAVQPESEVDVVLHRVGVELVEEPEPLLGEGQRQGRGGRHRGNGLLHVGGGVAGAGGQRGHRAVVEQHPGRQLHVQCGADPGHHPERQQGVAAQLEEVLVGADVLKTEHLGPDRGDGLLDRARRLARARRGRRGLGIGIGQRVAVQLAARRQGQPRQRHERGGDHVLGQRGREELAQAGRVGQGLVGGHQVGHQAPVLRGVAARRHRGTGHGRVAQQRGLDFARLDPVAPDLDLVVGAPQVVQDAVGVPAHHVTGAVHPLARPLERVGHEPLGGQREPSQVAAGESGPGQVQLAFRTHVHRTQPLVQHVGAGTGDRAADGDRTGRQPGPGFDEQGDTPHRRLGRPVLVDHGGARVSLPPAAQCPVGQGLAADDQFPGRGERLGQRQQHRQVARRDLDERRLPGQRRGAVVEVADQHAAAHDQRSPHRGDRQVEGHRAVQQRGTGQPGVVRRAVAEVLGELPVLDAHALGPAGRAGGVDDVSQVFRSHRGGGRRDRLVLGVGADGVQVHQRRLGRGHPLGEPPLGQHRADPGVGQHERQPLPRVARVQRQVGATGLEHAEHADDQVRAAFGAHADQHVRSHAARDQLTRQSGGPRVEFGVAQRFRSRAHRWRVRDPAHLLVERLEQKPDSHRDPQTHNGRKTFSR